MKALLFLLCLSAQAQPAVTNAPVVVALSTNVWTNVVQVLETQPIETACPECGGINHHERQVTRVAVRTMVYATSVVGGQTNRWPVWSGPTSYAIATNTVLRQRVQPGFAPPSPPPLTPSTNRVSELVNPVDGRTRLAAVFNGALAPHDDWLEPAESPPRRRLP